MEEIIGTEIIHPEEIRLGHIWHEINVLNQVIFDYLPYTFIEIGVHEGGLAYCLIPITSTDYNPPVYYIGIELNCGIVKPQVIELFGSAQSSVLLCKDCMSDIPHIIAHCKPGIKLIYCDNGHKAEELKAYAPYCKSGDILMAHDFWDGVRQVRGVPEPHPEVLPADIEFLENDPTFERLPEELFKETRIIGFRKL